MSLIDDALKRAQAAGRGERRGRPNRPWIPTPMPDPGSRGAGRCVRWARDRSRRWPSRPPPARGSFGADRAGGHAPPRRERARRGAPALPRQPRDDADADAVALATPVVVEPPPRRSVRASEATPPPMRRPRPTAVSEIAAAPAPAPPPPARAPRAAADGKTYAGAVDAARRREDRARRDRLVGDGAARALERPDRSASARYVEGFSVAKIEEDRVELEKDGVTIYVSVK